MKFLVSSSAGRLGYIDGNQFLYSEIEREPRTWLATGHGLVSYALLHASDIIEFEADTIEEGVQRAKEEAYFSKALNMLDTMLDPKQLWIDEAVAKRLLRFYETTAKHRINDVLGNAPLPQGITIDALKAAIAEQPLLSEIFGVIIKSHEPNAGLVTA
jgi:hypothetical protein